MIPDFKTQSFVEKGTIHYLISLHCRPPSGIRIDEHTFCFDSIVYLKFSFDLKIGETHLV